MSEEGSATRVFGVRLRLTAGGLTDSEVASIYSALPDATVMQRDGKVFIDLDREAPSFVDAAVQAVRDTERIRGLHVAGVEAPEGQELRLLEEEIGRLRAFLASIAADGGTSCDHAELARAALAGKQER